MKWRWNCIENELKDTDTGSAVPRADPLTAGRRGVAEERLNLVRRHEAGMYYRLPGRDERAP